MLRKVATIDPPYPTTSIALGCSKPQYHYGILALLAFCRYVKSISLTPQEEHSRTIFSCYVEAQRHGQRGVSAGLFLLLKRPRLLS
ncbi:hypothetical protein LX32DRAFT_235645 [Colletotrichum zoysiae]|uniref:Uncharacterized protein n=1 Tax=Colletotrichum zoysiae TaxID=1216348 RepID=A0AAD9HMV9_9PEZI|nr:hypothetical protein LX32DRAFT_235645 [Colletotrichum zoysiae]